MEGRIYVPNNKDIKGEILREHHDPADIGHLGQHRMQELIKRTYWWPGLKEDVKKYVQGYVKCQQNKVQHHGSDHVHYWILVRLVFPYGSIQGRELMSTN